MKKLHFNDFLRKSLDYIVLMIYNQVKINVLMIRNENEQIFSYFLRT